MACPLISTTNGCSISDDEGFRFGNGAILLIWIGSYGRLIENDFMVRKDLLPWLCALYIEESERGNAPGSKLLAHGRQEAKALGFNKVYLCTEHIGFYEKYGWCFFGLEESEWGGKTRVYEIMSGE